MKVRSTKSLTSYFGLFIMKNSYFFLFNFLSYSAFLILNAEFPWLGSTLQAPFHL